MNPCGNRTNNEALPKGEAQTVRGWQLPLVSNGRGARLNGMNNVM